MAWWNGLPNGARDWIAVGSVVVGLVGGAFAVGAATSTTIDDHRDLPERVTSLEVNDQRQDTILAYLIRIDSQRVRVWRGFDETSEAVAEMQCIMRAEVEGRNPATCLPTLGGPRR